MKGFITFPCSKCFHELFANDTFIGKTLKCNVCGHPSTVPHNSVPLTREQERLRDEHRRQREPSDNTRSSERDDEKERARHETHGTFACANCGITIRLVLPPPGRSFRCANCKHGYNVSVIAGAPPTILIVPEGIREIGSTKPPLSRRFPQHVLDAFATLGIEPTNELQTIKTAFRDMVAQYHPDKVAHLGKDLKHVAEEKTKALVNALHTIQRHVDSD